MGLRAFDDFTKGVLSGEGQSSRDELQSWPTCDDVGDFAIYCVAGMEVGRSRDEQTECRGLRWTLGSVDNASGLV
jgi:hypothetical protein